MKKTKILLSYKISAQNYIDALCALGAEPTAEYLPEVNTDYDGLILCGGGDVDPKYFNEQNDGSKGIDLDRDEAEMALLRAYADAGKPILGICRGHQIINVFFGGSLYQHIPEADLHTSKNGVDEAHIITADADSVLGRLYGERFSTNSAHHQAIKALGAGLRGVAWWEDKYIEAIEHESLPILGVQWHPERMCFAKEREDTVCGAKILEYFLELCKKAKR